MRLARTLLVATGTILGLTVLVPWASADPGFRPFHLKKECSEFTGSIPSFCTVTSANVPAIPPGAKVIYFGPVLGDGSTNPNFLSSNAVITDGHGNTTSGYCIVLANNVGTCAFREGAGTLTGFRMSAKVTVDANGIWRWDGTYLLDPFPGR